MIAKFAMAPPVELIVNPVAEVFTVLLSVNEERVKAGAASAGATATATGSGGGGGVAVVTDVEIAEANEEPAALIAVNENV